MNRQTINELRQLLDAYYSANNSPDDIKRIMALLKADDLPDQFSADRRLFEAIEAAKRITIPEDLAEKIAMRLDSSRPAKRLFTGWAKALCAAASITVIALISYNFGNRHSADTQIADANPTPKTIPVAVVNETPLESSPEQTAESIDSKPEIKRRHKSSRHIEQAAATATACREITDDAEALAFTEAVLALVNNRLQPASDAVENISSTINNINRAINNSI